MDPKDVIEVFRRNVTEHYFDLNGRVHRQEFWYFVLASVVVSIGAALIDLILGTGLLRPAVGLALLLPSTGLGIRRLQDIGRNGTLVWIGAGLYALLLVLSLIGLFFITSVAYGPYAYAPLAVSAGAVMFGSLVTLVSLANLVVAFVLIYFWAQPGVAGPNQYGPDPKEVPAAPPA